MADEQGHRDEVVENDPWADPDHSAVTDDPWHAHSSDEEPPQESHGVTSPGAIALVGVGSFVILLILIGIVAVYFNQVARRTQVEKIERVDLGQSMRTQLAEERQRLSSYGWVDPEQERVHIPIEQAMEQIREEYASSE